MQNNDQTVKELVSDEQIAAVWGNANFGDNVNPREIIMDTLLKYAADFSSGSTATRICSDLGLLNGWKKGRKIALSKKGRRYLYYAVRSTITAAREYGRAEGGVREAWKWQPIEKAPKCWDNIILYVPETDSDSEDYLEEVVTVGHFSPEEYDGDDCWYIHGGILPINGVRVPTHWMPLPEAPTTSAEAPTREDDEQEMREAFEREAAMVHQ